MLCFAADSCGKYSAVKFFIVFSSKLRAVFVVGEKKVVCFDLKQQAAGQNIGLKDAKTLHRAVCFLQMWKKRKTDINFLDNSDFVLTAVDWKLSKRVQITLQRGQTSNCLQWLEKY